MANAVFDEAFEIGQVNEGGWNHVVGDAGGETYCGIARNSWPNWKGWAKLDQWKVVNRQPHYNEVFSDEEIPGLPQDVKDFYEVTFWEKMHGDDMALRKVAIFFYDWFINSMTVATKHLQGLLGITSDGVFGSGTLAATNDAGEVLLDKLHASRGAFYTSHVQAVPADAKFLVGWDKRSDNLYNKLKAEQ